jgi:hypothetical protein
MGDFADLERVALEHALRQRQQPGGLMSDAMKIHSSP